MKRQITDSIIENSTDSDLESTYSFQRSLNDDKIFSFKTKLIFISILRVFKTYNLLLNITYFLI